MNLQRLEWHLENWADYMKRDSNKLGYPQRSLCIAGGGGSVRDAFDIMCDEADIVSAKAMDSIIDSISKPQRAAINHVWLKVGHHYPTQELDYDEALTAIIRLANKRGLM